MNKELEKEFIKETGFTVRSRQDEYTCDYVRWLENKINDLKEYKFMYEELCK